MAATIAAGAFSGPVGSAGAGVPAALPTERAQFDEAFSPIGPLATDQLGTHTGPSLTSPKVHAKGEPTARRLAGCGGTLYGGGFTTQLASTWTLLAARSAACTSATQTGSYGSGIRFTVSRETNGQGICRGRTYGYGSSIWFKTARGYVWSGGTTNPRWNISC